MQLGEELKNFSYREIAISPQDLFPRVDIEKLRAEYQKFVRNDPHLTLFTLARELWHGGYEQVMRECGFWEQDSVFNGSCHQCTPILGLVLHSLGFQVAYLECFRIHEEPFFTTGHIERVDPEEETSQLREEFIKLGRIPYCFLEVTIDDVPYYLTGKHLKPEGNGAVALLTPVCYRPFTGVFHHQDDPSRSGIYIKTVLPEEHITTILARRVVWMKQTQKDPAPELFATFLRMDIV
jgi:hypothetical protein